MFQLMILQSVIVREREEDTPGWFLPLRVEHNTLLHLHSSSQMHDHGACVQRQRVFAPNLPCLPNPRSLQREPGRGRALADELKTPLEFVNLHANLSHLAALMTPVSHNTTVTCTHIRIHPYFHARMETIISDTSGSLDRQAPPRSSDISYFLL